MTKNEQVSNAYGTASLVLSIIGLVLFLMPYIAIFLSILAVIFYGVQKRKDNEANVSTKGSTTAGLVMGIIGIVLNAVMLIFVLAVLTIFGGI
jgi:uncharacterized membrane protein YbaN (DUF454 family)